MAFTRPRGTRDLFDNEARRLRWVERRIRETFESFGYSEIITPTLEKLELITAKSGEEIVEHLYDFKDKAGRKYALRPELTAPVMRAYVNSLQKAPKPVKLYYISNCFRYERPQSGRYREFWQAGVELIGSPTPEGEAEILAISNALLDNLGLKDFAIYIGHIGVLRKLLTKMGITEQSSMLGMIDREEYEELDERLIACEVDRKSRELLFKIMGLSGGRDVLERVGELLEDEEIEGEMERFEETLDFAEELGVGYSVDMGIARGLDYYTGMVFEIYAKKLGAENQICGGGSYRLAEIFSGSPISTCGFAYGLDRLILALEKEGVALGEEEGSKVYIVPVSRDYLSEALKIASKLRAQAPCEVELNRRKLGKALSYASKKGFEFAVIVGEEVKENKLVVKNLKSREQRVVEMGRVKEAVHRNGGG